MLPPSRHVFVIMLENEDYSVTFETLFATRRLADATTARVFGPEVFTAFR